MTVAPLLAAESIGKTFRTRRVLNSASLWVRSGVITAVVGRNGEGKSTLLKIAAGVLRPDFGTVRYRQEHLGRARLANLAQKGLFFLPEHPLLSTSFSVRDHLMMIQRRFGGGAADTAVESLEIGELLDRSPQSLSLGERRRADIALAVARRPDCLLADEPFLRITPKDAETVAGVFRALAAAGCAIALTGHEIPMLFDLADEVSWMTAGTTHALGSPKQAREHHQFGREYLGIGGRT